MPPDNNGLDVSVKQQLDALAQEVARLGAAHAHARHVRMILTVVTFVLCLAIIISFYQLGNRVMGDDNLERLRAVAEKRIEKRSGDYMRQVQLLVDRTSPVIGDAFTRQVKKDMPAYLKMVEHERGQFADEVQATLSAKLKQRYEHALQKHEGILKKEFPQINDPVQHERMMTNLQLALDRALEKHCVTDLKVQFESLYATWDQFPAAPRPRPNDPPLEDQFVGNLLKLLQIKLSNSDQSMKN
jgi:hypothetical protein